MRLQFQIALRNLFRNGRRTLLSLAIIALGTAMSFSVRGYVESSLTNIQGGIVSQFGNFQIASPLLFDNEAEGYEYLIFPEDVETIRMALSQYPEVVDVSTSISFSGLASFGRRSKVLQGIATRPGNQALDYNDLLIDGPGLSPDDQGKVLIGQSLAEERDLKPGDVFRVNLSTVDGAYNVGSLEVAGVFSLNSQQFEGQLIFVPIDYVQALLNTNGIGNLIIKLENIEDSRRVADRVESELQSMGLSLEARTWDELSEFFQQIKGFFNALFVFLTVAVSILVFFIVLQVLTMAFLERTREVGTIRALGTKTNQVFFMFITEGVMLGLLGGVSGALLGWVISIGFNSLNIGWTPPGAIDPVSISITASLEVALIPFLVGLFATSFSALFPSMRSAKVSIVNALRTR